LEKRNLQNKADAPQLNRDHNKSFSSLADDNDAQKQVTTAKLGVKEKNRLSTTKKKNNNYFALIHFRRNATTLELSSTNTRLWLGPIIVVVLTHCPS